MSFTRKRKSYDGRDSLLYTTVGTRSDLLDVYNSESGEGPADEAPAQDIDQYDSTIEDLGDFENGFGLTHGRRKQRTNIPPHGSEAGQPSPAGTAPRISRIPQSGPMLSLQALTSRTVSFADLGISPSLVNALSNMSIKRPTEIQAACIPPLLRGMDVIGNAKTGSGKTIAFAAPILQQLSVDPCGLFALVLTPTRELAFQIADQFSVLGATLNARTTVIVGGMDMMDQAAELRARPHVIVATPGRLIDLMRSSSGEWSLGRVRFLILDEADRLLTPTFAPDLQELFAALPSERQTGLFTATLTPAIEALAEVQPRPGKTKPFIHRVLSNTETVETLKQHYLLCPLHVRELYLYFLLCHPPESILHLRRPPSAMKASRSGKRSSQGAPEDDTPLPPPPTIIFTTHPRTAARLTLLLQHLSLPSTSLHSHLTQRQRLTSLSLFRSRTIPILVATDVASRGLDIEDVAMVINWDMPGEGREEEYVHRVGRTARAGRGGVAISFIGGEEDSAAVRRVEARINTQLSEYSLPEQKVLEHLNLVSTAKRLANMELHDSKFGEREAIRRKKRAK